jgi:cobalamin transport system substrate-binding protein
MEESMRSARRTIRTTRTMVGLLAGLSLVAAACGSDDGATGAATDAATDATTGAPAATEAAIATDAPVATDDTAATEASPAPDGSADGTTDAGDEAPMDVPERVVSLSPTHTEIMFAIGADDLLVAVDDFSNYPIEALELPHELSGFEPNVEAIAEYEPDLVLTGGDFTGLGTQLTDLGIDWWDGPAPFTVDEIYTQIEELGDAVGRSAEAEELVSSMQADIEELIESTPESAEPLHLYHELDPTYFSVDSTTFIGDVYSKFGLRNIADETEGDSGGYPQLNAEFIVSANPELIFLADTKCCGESLVTVSDRDGWDAITAVQTGSVIEMDDDIASRWGPRIVEYAQAIAAAIAQVNQPA